jgi:hypothetical protein
VSYGHAKEILSEDLGFVTAITSAEINTGVDGSFLDCVTKFGGFFYVNEALD